MSLESFPLNAFTLFSEFTSSTQWSTSNDMVIFQMVIYLWKLTPLINKKVFAINGKRLIYVGILRLNSINIQLKYGPNGLPKEFYQMNLKWAHLSFINISILDISNGSQNSTHFTIIDDASQISRINHWMMC